MYDVNNPQTGKLMSLCTDTIEYITDAIKETENPETVEVLEKLRKKVWEHYHRNGLDIFFAVPVDKEEEEK